LSIQARENKVSNAERSKTTHRLSQYLLLLETPEELAKLAPMIEAFKKYSPGFTGPISSQESVEKVLKVVEGATVEKDGGSFVSHHGNKTWL
jgi:hypothetical protein